jgi:1-acyl-sn-glycerol-3-phosphate acyltransferase
MWILIVLSGALAVHLVRWRRSGLSLVDYHGLGLVYLYARLWHRWSSNGPAPLPPTGGALIVSEHTCSADPAFLVAGCRRRVTFLIADEFFAGALLKRFFTWLHAVAVRRDGCDVKAVRESLRNLAAGRVLCIFPEGGLYNVGHVGRRPAKAGVALIALRSRAPVYPAAIRGGPQTVHVLTSWLAPTRRPVRVTYGPPIDLSAYYDRPINRKLLQEVTRRIMQTICDLAPEEASEVSRSRDYKAPRKQGKILTTTPRARKLDLGLARPATSLRAVRV